ncbi:hypothetical protein HOO65_070297 [Ceratocystis lukuohia]|uniref:Secreted protein n=1 Tax=Ceratocystis lukuohia TaxID=2019550 RepID=A0ABR4MC43_9PEZI
MKFSFSLSLALSLCSVAQAGELTEAGDLVQAENSAQASGFAQPDGPTPAGDLTEADGLVQSDTPAPTDSLFQTDSPVQDSKPAEAAPPVPITDVLDDKNYEVKTWGNNFLVFSPEYGEGCEFVDVMGFYPKWKVADIETSKNDEEPEHENKLSLTEVYNALAKRRGVEPGEIRLVAFSVEKEDDKTDELIAGIRESRNIDLWGEVRLFPNDEEWNMILATEYYVKLLQVANRPVQRIIIRTRDHVDWWSRVVHTNRIFFSFGPLERKTPVPGTTTEVSATEDDPEIRDKKQEAEFIALLAEEDMNEDARQAEMARELADRALEAEERV